MLEARLESHKGGLIACWQPGTKSDADGLPDLTVGQFSFRVLYFDKTDRMGYKMKPKSMVWLSAFLFIVACELPGLRSAEPTPQIVPTQEIQSPLPTLEPVCISDEPTQEDIDRGLAFTGNIFASPEWERSYAVMDGRVGVTWYNDTLGAVAYLEVLIFPCGYEEPDLDAYFSDENWEVIFENYDGYEIVSECKMNNGLQLYEVGASNMGFDYYINYWVRNDADTRVVTMMMTFPVESTDLLDEYSSRIFPTLSTCP
jgi:hypothetical protein